MPPTSGQYSKSRRLAIGENALKKHRIYLDQKYWVKLRQAKHGHPEDKTDVEIFDSIQTLVKEGKIICPASAVVLNETFRIPSPEVRLQHAEIIDELSGGITIQPTNVLDQAELMYFFRKNSVNENQLHPAKRMVWNDIGHISGEIIPTIPSFDSEINNKIQIEFLKHMSQVTLVELIKNFHGLECLTTDWDGKEHAKIGTANQKAFEHEFETYDEVFMSEVAGTLDGLSKDIESVLNYLREEQFGEGATLPKEELSEYVRQTRNLIYHSFESGLISTELPGIHIIAGLYAAKRYVSKNEKASQKGPYCKPGDIRDHFHARTALPYCNAFFTERRLGLFLTQSPLNFNECYSCTVLFENESILYYLKTLP